MLTDLVASLKDQGEAANRGDLAGLEQMLAAQSVSLNSIFIELARRAALNMGEHLGATESYMRMALKAQAQCRVTVETLAEMKNPHPVAFVKQANISNGPQQVNNGPVPPGAIEDSRIPPPVVSMDPPPLPADAGPVLAATRSKRHGERPL